MTEGEQQLQQKSLRSDRVAFRRDGTAILESGVGDRAYGRWVRKGDAVSLVTRMTPTFRGSDGQRLPARETPLRAPEVTTEFVMRHGVLYVVRFGEEIELVGVDGMD